ncbi:ferredoxin [candidate division MSBL1 archaeon SCGC-AAA259E19]|uniref:Ferredoxin n=1 Tax=candidate division MSBL1 archaeon SCGC-AAA259E19 TaxID=1698264 RepID=A0A133UII0_9EURY|nr:ferredoxin [candidate division MSBL1 archaeon SCGC-AAA259E19]
MKKPVVDKDKCQGHMVCVALAPDVFEIDDNGKSEVKDPEGAEESKIQQAIDGCPVDAISWESE